MQPGAPSSSLTGPDSPNLLSFRIRYGPRDLLSFKENFSRRVSVLRIPQLGWAALTWIELEHSLVLFISELQYEALLPDNFSAQEQKNEASFSPMV